MFIHLLTIANNSPILRLTLINTPRRRILQKASHPDTSLGAYLCLRINAFKHPDDFVMRFVFTFAAVQCPFPGKHTLSSQLSVYPSSRNAPSSLFQVLFRNAKGNHCNAITSAHFLCPPNSIFLQKVRRKNAAFDFILELLRQTRVQNPSRCVPA